MNKHRWISTLTVQALATGAFAVVVVSSVAGVPW